MSGAIPPLHLTPLFRSVELIARGQRYPSVCTIRWIDSASRRSVYVAATAVRHIDMFIVHEASGPLFANRNYQVALQLSPYP
jgi:hypothetical protein